MSKLRPKQAEVTDQSKKVEEAINEINLDEEVRAYIKVKAEMDKIKAIADSANEKIKAFMKSKNMDEYFTDDGYGVVYSISKRPEFLEDKLIERVRPFKIRGLIKKKEFVDMDILESAIYNEQIPATTLTDCQVIKEVASLRIKKKSSR